MDYQYLIKLDILRNRILEYFSKNNKKRSVVFESSFGENKTYWKVSPLKKNNYLVVEIQPNKRRFIIEAPVGQVKAQQNADLQQQLQQQQAAQQPPMPPPQDQGMAAAGVPMEPLSAMPIDALPPMPGPALPPPMPAAPAMPAAVPSPPAPPSPVPPESPPPEDAAAGTKVDWDKIVGVIEKAKQEDPIGFKQRFGATPEQQLQNPSVPPEVAIGMEPPDERAGKEIRDQMEPLTEKSTEFANVASIFSTAMTPPFDQNKIKNAFNQINTMIGRFQDPGERQQAASMVGALNSMILPDDTILAASKKTSGRIIAEEDIDPTPASDPIGLDVTPQQPQQQNLAEPMFRATVSEEAALVHAMRGQTIKDVSLANTDDKVQLEFKLATTKWPAVFSWDKSGKLVFNFKDRNYTLHKWKSEKDVESKKGF